MALWGKGESERIRYQSRSGRWLPAEISNWKNDKKNGRYRLFTLNGDLKVDGNFEDDVRQGEYKIWNRAGDLVHRSIYKNGKEIKDLLNEFKTA